MSYTLTFYTGAVTPTQEFYLTKKEATTAMHEAVEEEKKTYNKNSGFKKVGTLVSGRISFDHPYYGTDFVVKLEKN